MELLFPIAAPVILEVQVIPKQIATSKTSTTLSDQSKLTPPDENS